MRQLSKACILFILVAFLLFVQVAHSTAEPVEILFIWENPQVDWPSHGIQWIPGCEPCEAAQEQFWEKNDTMTQIQQNYTGRVSVKWIWWYSNKGIDARMNYSVIVSNSIVIKRVGEANFTRILNSTWNVPYVVSIIDAYLAGWTPPPSSPMPLIAVLAGAFSFGFFETFSPCLIILLSFVLSYSLGETTHFKEGFLKVMIFSIGFIFATVIMFLGSAGLVIASSIFAFRSILMYVVLALALFFGLDLLGLNLTKLFKLNIETKPLVQKLSRRFVYTYAGLILLGFLFYFLDPCLAPVFVVMLGTFQETLITFLPLVLFVFCVGVIIPFIGIGVAAGSISKLVRSAYLQRSKIRAASGIILISYSLYFVSFYLIYLDIVATLAIVSIAAAFMIILTMFLSSRNHHT
jgi:cytochrome c biogenesis protein CcdA